MGSRDTVIHGYPRLNGQLTFWSIGVSSRLHGVRREMTRLLPWNAGLNAGLMLVVFIFIGNQSL
jgi:hypothetical protein